MSKKRHNQDISNDDAELVDHEATKAALLIERAQRIQEQAQRIQEQAKRIRAEEALAALQEAPRLNKSIGVQSNLCQ